MKVENNSLNPLSPRKTEDVRPVDTTKRTSSSGQVAPKDKATVSDRARMLSKARVAFADTPDVRTDVVDALKKKISDGNYEIQFSALAQKLYSHRKE